MANRAYDVLVKTGWYFDGTSWNKEGEDPQTDIGALALELEKHAEFVDYYIDLLRRVLDDKRRKA